MRSDSLLRRVRWGNVARLVALPAFVALVVLWPRLSPPPPRLPAATAAPVASGPRVTPRPAEQSRQAEQQRAADTAGKTPQGTEASPGADERGELQGLVQQGQQYGGIIDTAFSVQTERRGRRECGMRIVGNSSQYPERQSARVRHPRYDVRFHVGGNRPGFPMQCGFQILREQDGVAARYDTRVCIARANEGTRPCFIRAPALVLANDFRRNDDRAECKPGRQRTTNAEGEKRTRAARNRGFDLLCQSGTVAARDHRIAAAAQQLRLPLHAGDGEEHSQRHPP